VKPPFDPSMSDGCSIPGWLRSLLPILEAQCNECRPACVDHDRAYYEGGTEQERELADAALRDAVTPIIGEQWALEWYNALRLFGGGHWGTGRTWDGRVLWQDVPMEAP
jgi:hypothetical protein